MKKNPIFLILFATFSFFTNAASQADTIWNQADGLGRKQGYWKKEYPEGGLIYKGLFKDDRPVGMMHRFFENGVRQADLIYLEDGDAARAKLYFRNGTVAATGNYLGRQKDSIWSYYSYYTSTLAYKESYLRGKKQGASLRYYPQGGVSEILYWKDDMKHGQWQQFYEDSTLRMSSSYQMDKLHGEYKVWTPQKISRIEGNYKMGKMDGNWYFYNAGGELDNKLEYSNGELLNKDVFEEWAKKYMDEVEENLGKIPEVDIENFFERK